MNPLEPGIKGGFGVMDWGILVVGIFFFGFVVGSDSSESETQLQSRVFAARAEVRVALQSVADGQPETARLRLRAAGALTRSIGAPDTADRRAALSIGVSLREAQLDLSEGRVDLARERMERALSEFDSLL